LAQALYSIIVSTERKAGDKSTSYVPDGKFEIGVEEVLGNLHHLVSHKLGVLDILVVVVDVVVDHN
jgi:hypothetical protein